MYFPELLLARLSLFSFTVVVFVGCGRSGVERISVSGTVTFRGQPVPSGIISFTPDVKKGNRGPQGVAKITDGHYTTDDHGKGSVSGPQVIEIRGYGGGGASGRADKLPFSSGKPLFPTYYTEADVKPGGAALDFEVPDAGANSQSRK